MDNEKFSEMSEEEQINSVHLDNHNLFSFAEHGPYSDKDKRVSTAERLLEDHLIYEMNTIEKLNDEIQLLKEKSKKMERSANYYKGAAGFLYGAVIQYAKPCHIDKLHDKTYRCMVSDLFCDDRSGDFGWDSNLSIVTVPPTVDINAPIEIKKDVEDRCFEVFRGGFKLFSGVAQAIREIEKNLSDPKDETRPSIQEWEVEIWDKLQAGTKAKMSYGKLSSLTGRPVNTIKSYVSKLRKG